MLGFASLNLFLTVGQVSLGLKPHFSLDATPCATIRLSLRQNRVNSNRLQQYESSTVVEYR